MRKRVRGKREGQAAAIFREPSQCLSMLKEAGSDSFRLSPPSFSQHYGQEHHTQNSDVSPLGCSMNLALAPLKSSLPSVCFWQGKSEVESPLPPTATISRSPALSSTESKSDGMSIPQPRLPFLGVPWPIVPYFPYEAQEGDIHGPKRSRLQAHVHGPFRVWSALDQLFEALNELIHIGRYALSTTTSFILLGRAPLWFSLTAVDAHLPEDMEWKFSSRFLGIEELGSPGELNIHPFLPPTEVGLGRILHSIRSALWDLAAPAALTIVLHCDLDCTIKIFVSVRSVSKPVQYISIKIKPIQASLCNRPLGVLKAFRIHRFLLPSGRGTHEYRKSLPDCVIKTIVLLIEEMLTVLACIFCGWHVILVQQTDSRLKERERVFGDIGPFRYKNEGALLHFHDMGKGSWVLLDREFSCFDGSAHLCRSFRFVSLAPNFASHLLTPLDRPPHCIRSLSAAYILYLLSLIWRHGSFHYSESHASLSFAPRQRVCSLGPYHHSMNSHPCSAPQSQARSQDWSQDTISTLSLAGTEPLPVWHLRRPLGSPAIVVNGLAVSSRKSACMCMRGERHPSRIKDAPRIRRKTQHAVLSYDTHRIGSCPRILPLDTNPLRIEGELALPCFEFTLSYESYSSLSDEADDMDDPLSLVLCLGEKGNSEVLAWLLGRETTGKKPSSRPNGLIAASRKGCGEVSVYWDLSPCMLTTGKGAGISFFFVGSSLVGEHGRARSPLFSTDAGEAEGYSTDRLSPSSSSGEGSRNLSSRLGCRIKKCKQSSLLTLLVAYVGGKEGGIGKTRPY
ncbi:hypothetical protein ZIOFF_074511 (mitochondrion) [Zingiber officinale]|uniref:Uncharacterized protein n=1 Tax=Zingiber officinale TaxID=94328 RepID=A0A8J5C4V8_ZINOF|nr:hypothetical protein ZIOFF_074511 [Zingiber officinale]